MRKVFNNWVQRKIFGPIRGKYRRLLNAAQWEVSINIIQVIK